MKAETIAPPMRLRAEVASKADHDGRDNDAQAFSTAMESASKEATREVQNDLHKEQKKPVPDAVSPNEKNVTQDQPSKIYGQQTNHCKKNPLLPKQEAGSEQSSPTDINANIKNPSGTSTVDYLFNLPLTPPAFTADVTSPQDQSSTGSELSVSAAQTAVILSLLDFPATPLKLPSDSAEQANSLGATPATSPIFRMASASLNALSSSRYPGQLVASTNVLQGESTALDLKAPASTPSPSKNFLDLGVKLPMDELSPVSTTTLYPNMLDASEKLNYPEFTPLQSFPQNSTEIMQNIKHSDGTIFMGNGEDFTQSTTTFLVKAHANGSHEAVLNVSPDHLGPLRADIAMNELPDGTKSMSLTLTLSSEKAMDMAKENLAKLQSELALAGISCPTIQLKMDTPIAPSSQAGTSEGSLHSSFNQGSNQQSHREDARYKRISYDDQANVLVHKEQNLSISLFDRTT